MGKVIDNTNLGYLISKIKAAFWPKTDVIQIGLDNTPISGSDNLVKSGGVYTALNSKQDTLVSGTSIKTINNESLLGSGNISIAGGSGSGEENVIEAITFNGTPATITNKTAAITATIPDAQVQSDWNATTGLGVILNKPTIPAAVTESTVSGWGFTKNTGTYSKPSGGIPETDLASAVQTSLGKADTALQSYTETDPTVPSWAKQSTKPTYTASEVGALPDTTVIPTVPTTVSSFTNDANYVKHVLCANEAAYNTISNKDSGTLYLIPVTQ